VTVIEQALYGGQDRGGYRFLAKSPGFRDEWLPEAERLCTAFGERPAGVACPGAVFARPFGPRHVAVVQAADQGRDDAGRPGALAFRLLVLPRDLYADLGADPFRVADQFPPPWAARGELPPLEWPSGPPPRRTVEALRGVLDVPNSAVLLGGTQALLDGGRLVFERTEPAGHLVRSLWALLPDSSRRELWPATYTFANDPPFDVAVVPRASGPQFAGYVDEVRAGEYPEGRYELALQIAVEAGDQPAVDSLMSRRSRSQALRLGAGLLAVFLLVPAAVALFDDLIPRVAPPAPPPAKAAPPRLPDADQCPRLDRADREALADRLTALAGRVGADLPRGTSDQDLIAAVAALDAHLGTPDPARDPGPLGRLGPIQRQLCALLWKHGVTDYKVPGMNPAELVEKLDHRLAEGGR
jgi:hypothetical protein